MELALYAPGLGYYSARQHEARRGRRFRHGAGARPLVRPRARVDARRRARRARRARRRRARRRQRRARGAVARHVREARPRRALLRSSSRARTCGSGSSARSHRSRAECSGSNGLPETPFPGVVVANEVLDALPVARFAIDDGEPQSARRRRRRRRLRLGDRPRVAGADGGRAQHRACAAATRCRTAIARRSASRCPRGFARSAASLERGSLLFADYGLVRSDYYHEQRADGTLVCHYRHRAHDDPFAVSGAARHHGVGRLQRVRRSRCGGRLRRRRLHDARPVSLERARGAAARAGRRPRSRRASRAR